MFPALSGRCSTWGFGGFGQTCASRGSDTEEGSPAAPPTAPTAPTAPVLLAHDLRAALGSPGPRPVRIPCSPVAAREAACPVSLLFHSRGNRISASLQKNLAEGHPASRCGRHFARRLLRWRALPSLGHTPPSPASSPQTSLPMGSELIFRQFSPAVVGPVIIHYCVL